MLADKAFDSKGIIAEMNERGAVSCISQHARRRTALPIDPGLYTSRHRIENFFRKLKEFKRIAMRAEKTDTSFAAMIHAVSALTDSRSISTSSRPSVMRQARGCPQLREPMRCRRNRRT